MTSTPTPRAHHRVTRSPKPAVGQAKVLQGDALLKDMERFRKKVTASPETARQFLVDLGVMTRDGKRKNLIRG